MIHTARLACALALALVTSLVVPVAAHAVGYQYWGFYQIADGEWGTSAMGPDATVPQDGAVDGYRFAVSAGDTPRVPRAVLAFEDICADTTAEPGMKRVGLVIDPGRPADAPQDVTPPQPGAQCVVAEPDATSQEVLTQAVGDLRLNDTGLVCAIAGYPQEGCGDEVAEPSPEALAADEPIDIPIAAAVGAGGDGADPTEEPAATDEAATSEATAGETATDDESTSTPSDATASDEATAADEATAEDDATAADEATAEGSDSSVPPWAWAVGVLVLLGILGWAANAARNRRLADANTPQDGQPRPPQER